MEALETVAGKETLSVVWDEAGYDLAAWLSEIGSRRTQKERCPVCYRMRLEATARKAQELSFSAISTTLLYSRYQQHDVIREIGEQAAKAQGLDFHYEDFREGWDDGVAQARELGIYRQPYCGCIFSEAERYAKRQEKMQKRLRN